MNNLYKKICEAVSTGINKALILDDEDVSMNYQYKKVNNSPNLMSYYVNELLQDSANVRNNLKQIMTYHKQTNYTYKVKNFNELKDLFEKINHIKTASFEWIDMKKYISLVLEDDTEINFYDYEKTDKKPVFLKFTNDDLLGTENEILIYLQDHYKITFLQWQTNQVQMADNEYFINDKKYKCSYADVRKIADKDYFGFENSIRIKNNDIIESSAIDYCMDQIIQTMNHIYQGYLPSMGQLRIMADNLDLINYILKKINLSKLSVSSEWYSSTQFNDSLIWMLSKNCITSVSSAIYGKGQISPLFIKK